MLGIDFSELGLIVIVALVVLGPTRLPGLVRKIGRWVGKARTMAREFQQQLENEVNLEELNRATDKIARQVQESSPPAPPEFSGDMSAIPPAAEPADSNLAASGYPYGAAEPAQEPAPEPAYAGNPDMPPDAAPPQPGDDTYSHAHAHGAAPMEDPPPEPEADTTTKKDSDAA